MTRVDVRKTYKLYIGGQFPRSESGHSYVVDDAKGKFVANAALASRKDARDAVLAARSAFGGWSGKTAYNRAQILYRVAEIMEDRRPQFVEALRQSEGLTPTQAGKVLDAEHRPARLVRRVGRQDHPGHRQRQPGRRPVLQPLDARTDRRRGRARPAAVQPARPGQGRRAGGGERQHRRGAERRPSAHWRPSRSPRCWPRPTSRWRGQHPHRQARQHRADAGLAHGRERAST